MLKMLVALFACSAVLCQADAIYSLKYVDEDQSGFTLLFTQGFPSLQSAATAEGSYGTYSSVFVNGSLVPPSEFGVNGFTANGFVILGTGATLVQFDFFDSNGRIFHDGSAFVFDAGALGEGQTETVLGSGRSLPLVTSLTITNLAPEPATWTFLGFGIAGGLVVRRRRLGRHPHQLRPDPPLK
jgi:hypothetical protein